MDMTQYEAQAAAQGYVALAGMDEVGRGPFAGPVVAACVLLDWRNPIPGVRDSKKVTPRRREALLPRILETAAAVGIGSVPAGDIDRINILEATKRAMREAVAAMAARPDYVLVDAVQGLGLPMPTQPILHGDALSYLIAAASIVAKQTRDAYMIEMDAQYPGYGFAKHKGYGTPEHRAALKALGPCPLHRMTFIRNWL
jgi:ribonuclease HII